MKTILVVDDNKTNLMSAKVTLSEQYKVIAVTMGAQALKYLQGNSCDLILLDVEMPEMDGFETLKKIHEMHLEKEPPVVFLTGNSDAVTITRCIDEGAMDVVFKPLVRDLLLTRMRNLLELSEYRNRN